MIIEITQHLTELEAYLNMLNTFFLSKLQQSDETKESSNVFNVLELMAKIETKIMDFNLLFKRLEIIQSHYDKLFLRYKDLLPHLNQMVMEHCNEEDVKKNT